MATEPMNERTNERTNEQTVNGQTLLDRRRRGLCIDCGINQPPLDTRSGFERELLCESCKRRRKESREAQQARQDKD